MNTWAPVWNGIVDSSLWDEPDYVVKVFLTMMAIKDADHICRFTAYQIGRKSRKSETEVLDALKILSSPDKKRLEKQEFDGRRIRSVEEGWLILNGEKYRSLVRLEMKRARNRRAQANYRQKHGKKIPPTVTEQIAEQRARNGDHEAAEAIMDAAEMSTHMDRENRAAALDQ